MIKTGYDFVKHNQSKFKNTNLKELRTAMYALTDFTPITADYNGLPIPNVLLPDFEYSIITGMELSSDLTYIVHLTD